MNVHPRRIAAALAIVTLAAGCGSSSSGPAFKTQSGLQISAASQTCLVHQTGKPTAAYEGGAGATTSDVLTFLAYYTANGNKKFCDGKSANSHDKAWAALYVTLDSSAAAKNVKGITG
ncbi:hypothetical protein acdb102_12480 [Acidothermaceae bacterium B102]|nr:hypothetical protein acdb102_12480 [Acidothermaceae bacterium B102]